MKTIFILLSTIIIATIIEEITAKYLLVEINHAEGQGIFLDILTVIEYREIIDTV